MTQLALYEMPKKECRRVAISVAIPKWLPPSLALWLRQRMAERPEEKLTVGTRFSKGERAAMKRRRPVPISAWAENHRVLEMSAIRGRWRNVFTPYLTGIMDVSGLPGVETVIICKSPQTGGSECGHNIVGYCIDCLPGPVMYVFPDELTARENAKDRIIPMIEASPRLRQYMTGYGDDASSLRINLLHMPIYLGWSGSVSRLGNKPIRILIVRVAGGEAHDDMANPAQGRENLDPDHGGRPDMEGAHRGGGCPLRFLGALPALRLFPAHGFRAHRMARKG